MRGVVSELQQVADILKETTRQLDEIEQNYDTSCPMAVLDLYDNEEWQDLMDQYNHFEKEFFCLEGSGS